MAICKLCDRDRKLIDAHLIPRCMYDLEEKLPLAVVGIYSGDRPKRSQIGIYDQDILCAECDGKLGVLDEYACKVFDPEKLELKVANATDGLAIDRDGTTFCYTIEGAQPEILSKFVLSVLWRSHHSSREEAKVVRLGSHADAIKSILLADEPIANHIYSVHIEYNVDFKITMLIGRHRPEGLVLNSFYTRNFGFHMKIDRQDHNEIFRLLCLAENRPVYAMAVNKLGTPFGRTVVSGLKRNFAKHGDPWKRRTS